jgi:hypothetical protein
MTGWADLNRHDPGITVLALFVWLAIGLLLGRRLVRAHRRGPRPV